MLLNSPKHVPYWNSTSGFNFDHITAVDISFCTSLRNFIQIGSPSAEKNDVMSIFKMADVSQFGFYGSNNGFFQKPCVTSYRSSIDIIAVKCLIFEKIVFILYFGDRHTDKQMDSIDTLSRSHCHERQLKKQNKFS